jgi:hypothetical protein
MSILASRYGFTRPAALAARLASLRTRFAPIASPVEVEDARTFTDEDAPPEMLPSPSTGTPAPRALVEEAARTYDAAYQARIEYLRALLTVGHDRPFVFGFDDLSPERLHALAIA